MTHNGVNGWIFNLVCPGNAMSVSHEGLLLLKSATVNRNLVFGEVCKEKHALVAYNNAWEFKVSNITGEMVRFPVTPYVSYEFPVAWEWEIQEAFFKYNNITPIWIKAYTWGTLNYITGQWSGKVGRIQRGEADYAIPGIAVTHSMCKVATFTGTYYAPYYWYTRYPLELTPMWNLFGLFTQGYNSKNCHFPYKKLLTSKTQSFAFVHYT